MSRRGAEGSVSMSAKSSACPERLGGLGPEELLSEEPYIVKRILGEAPAVKLTKLIKPKGGDLRELILPGGGDLCLRVWTGIRRMLRALIGWHRNASTHTPAFKGHLSHIDDFLDRKHHFHTHAWQLLGEREALRMHAELLFVLEDIMFERPLDECGALALLDNAVTLARQRGRDKLAKQRSEYLAKCLIGGAG